MCALGRDFMSWRMVPLPFGGFYSVGTEFCMHSLPVTLVTGFVHIHAFSKAALKVAPLEGSTGTVPSHLCQQGPWPTCISDSRKMGWKEGGFFSWNNFLVIELHV